MGWSRNNHERDERDDDGDGRSYDDETRQQPGFAGSWARVRPSLDNPMSWSVPFIRVRGIDVRIHLAFLLLVAYQLLTAIAPAANEQSVRLGIWPTVIAMTMLFAVVLLHEFGHCIACRRTGGSADEILMWPLGGLAYCAPDHRWTAHFWTAVGGPLVNVAILAITAPLVGLLTGSWLGGALPNPLQFAPPAAIFAEDGLRQGLLLALFSLHWIALLLLLFNLLPLYPLDGGRVLQALLWPRIGYTRSIRASCRAGFIGAIVLGVFGAVTMNLAVLGIAIFGGFTCVMTLKQLQYTEEALGFEDDEGHAVAAIGRADAEAERRERAAAQAAAAKVEALRQKDEAQRAREEAEFDRILDKIRASGIASLSAAEKRVLERETERRRGGG